MYDPHYFWFDRYNGSGEQNIVVYPDAVIDGNDKKTCEWVSKNPEKRCNQEGNEAFSKCPATCDPFCQLSCEGEGDYRVNGKGIRTCSLVAEKDDLSRCGLEEDLPYERCSATCNPGFKALHSFDDQNDRQ
jgi:hypothetical protein